ncbi:MAG: hypothetical protein GX607_08835 [Myxococcales bacterium]|jgi:triacylglycerol lipase|nr:hypothetical protein [Myxococcales bacterium]
MRYEKFMAVSRWGSDAFRQSCTAAGREALAMLRQATLLHRDVLSSPVQLPRMAHKTDLVVLLHGLFATAGVLRPLRERIEAETSAFTLSFTYAPGTSVQALAERVESLLGTVQGTQRIHLVGHSLGGLAVRWYVQEKVYDPRVVQTICLASPFAGSRHARLMPGSSGRDLLPGSALLRQLQEKAPHVDLPHLSLCGANDLLIERGAWLECGEHREFPGLGHNGILYDPSVIAEVVARVGSWNSDRDQVRSSHLRVVTERGPLDVPQVERWSSREELERELSERPARVSSGR